MQDNPHTQGRRRTWFVPSLLLFLATAGVGAALYPGMPDPVPVHWNGAAEPDGFAAKLFSWLSLQGWLGLTGPAVVWLPVLTLMVYATIIIGRVMSSAAAAAPRP